VKETVLKKLKRTRNIFTRKLFINYRGKKNKKKSQFEKTTPEKYCSNT